MKTVLKKKEEAMVTNKVLTATFAALTAVSSMIYLLLYKDHIQYSIRHVRRDIQRPARSNTYQNWTANNTMFMMESWEKETAGLSAPKLRPLHQNISALSQLYVIACQSKRLWFKQNNHLDDMMKFPRLKRLRTFPEQVDTSPFNLDRNEYKKVFTSFLHNK